MKLLDLLDSDEAMFCVLASIFFGVLSALWFIYGDSFYTGVLSAILSFVFYVLACVEWIKLERYKNG